MEGLYSIEGEEGKDGCGLEGVTNVFDSYRSKTERGSA